MKLVLLQDHKDLGRKGDEVDVAAGYARNYLIPQKVAATYGSGEAAQVLKERNERKKIKEESIQKIDEVDVFRVEFSVKAKEDDTTYSGITEKKIAEQVEKKYDLKKVSIMLDEPIKKLGDYEYTAKIGNKEKPVKVSVVST